VVQNQEIWSKLRTMSLKDKDERWHVLRALDVVDPRHYSWGFSPSSSIRLPYHIYLYATL
jgi:hypothetical protein